MVRVIPMMKDYDELPFRSNSPQPCIIGWLPSSPHNSYDEGLRRTVSQRSGRFVAIRFMMSHLEFNPTLDAPKVPEQALVNPEKH